MVGEWCSGAKINAAALCSRRGRARVFSLTCLLNLYAGLTSSFSPAALPPLPSLVLVGHITWDGGSVDFQFNVLRLFSSNARRRRAAFHPPCQVHAAGKLRGRGAGTSLAAPVQATSMDTSRAKSVASGQPTHTANMALHSWTAPKG